MTGIFWSLLHVFVTSESFVFDSSFGCFERTLNMRSDETFIVVKTTILQISSLCIQPYCQP